MNSTNSMEKKVKILLLGYSDSDTTGHVYGTYESLPAVFDKRLVVFSTVKKNRQIAFVDGTTLLGRVKRRIIKQVQNLIRYISVKTKVRVDINRLYHHFYGNEYTLITARQILNKHKGFQPDVISIHWVAEFISSKTIRDLHRLTGAKIVFCFVDEQHMTGGCHYPVDCNEYLTGCRNCPALAHGKKVAAVQMKKKMDNLQDLPKLVIGSPYDCRLVRDTSMFRNAVLFPNIAIPRMPHYGRSEARRIFNIQAHEFVIMIGANSLTDVRKGMCYSVDAIKLFAQDHADVCVLAPGNQSKARRFDVGTARSIYPGFLDYTKLAAAYCAADCFLSTTLADSGPKMVTFAIAQCTPVVSFNLGFAQDVVLHKQTGYIAKYKDTEDVAKGIEYIFNRGKDSFKDQCRAVVEKIKDIPSGWMQLYNFIIKERERSFEID